MASILLEDTTNKLYHKLDNLSEKRELHIISNINVLNKKGAQYTVYLWEVGDSTIALENKGYKEDPGLYDRRIIEYNNSTTGDLLTAWIKS
jgi:hypothetical protein